MNIVRNMLSEKNIPKTFWPEAVNWTVHVLNRSPTLAVRNQTPEEAWSGIKPSVVYFRVFGCISHVHVPGSKRAKLDDKSLACVLLGVSEGSKAYRLYDPASQKIIVSRDVVFEEDKCWNWDKQYDTAISCNLEWGEEEHAAAPAPAENGAHADNGDNGDHSGSEHAAVTEEDGYYSGSNHDATIAEGVREAEPTEHHASDLDIAAAANPSDDFFPAGLPSLHERRNRRPSVWLRDYETGDGLSEDDSASQLAMFAAADPIHLDDAVKSEKWRTTMDVEMEAIKRNGTWELMELPAGGKKVGVKWVYKTKLNEHGAVDKYKTRLVVKGYSQQYGVDYIEVFAPVARMETIRLVVALAAQRGWTIYQLDVRSAFLYVELNEEVFVDQPCGYVQKGNKHKVYKLKKALYGLKQTPRAWYSRIEAYFMKEGFEKCDYEHTLFTKTGKEGNILIISLYVDDLIYTGNDASMISEFKNSMKHEFNMTDLGKMRYFLGLEVLQKSTGVFINQKKYASEVLKRFGMDKSNSVRNPIVPGCKLVKDEGGVKVDNTHFKQMVGSLMYLTATRPDMMFVVSLISRYMENPTELHLQVAKRVLRYLKGTLDFGIFYKKGGNNDLVAYTDSDYAGDLGDRKSTSGYVFLLSSGTISWLSKKQPVVSLSTTEAEFIAAASCACQTVWLKRVLEKLGLNQDKTTIIHCDSSFAIKLSKNPVMHGRSKHIDVRFHFLPELTKAGTVELIYCNTQDQIADIMTKPLKLDAFLKLRALLGVCSENDIN
ncbi:Integrase catalytic domain-containing protein [Populus alba x Populus x berolinensis]|nr:Integrase catalytic domain-containing protein [Populus alba x Populus x berolinensis]